MVEEFPTGKKALPFMEEDEAKTSALLWKECPKSRREDAAMADDNRRYEPGSV